MTERSNDDILDRLRMARVATSCAATSYMFHIKQ